MSYILAHPRLFAAGIAIVATGLGALVGGTLVTTWISWQTNHDQIVGV
jgi:hypothetical protein